MHNNKAHGDGSSSGITGMQVSKLPESGKHTLQVKYPITACAQGRYS